MGLSVSVYLVECPEGSLKLLSSAPSRSHYVVRIVPRGTLERRALLTRINTPQYPRPARFVLRVYIDLHLVACRLLYLPMDPNIDIEPGRQRVSLTVSTMSPILQTTLPGRESSSRSARGRVKDVACYSAQCGRVDAPDRRREGESLCGCD